MSGFLCCSGRQDDLPPAADQRSGGAVLSGVARYEVNAAFSATSNGNGAAVPADSDFFQEKGSRFAEKESRFSDGGFPHHPQPHFWLHSSSRAPPPPPPPVLPDVVGHSSVVVAAATASSSQQHTMSPEASSRPFW